METPTTLTPKERLILSNQFRILEKLAKLIDPNDLGADTYRKFITILDGGYKFHYYEIFEHLPEELDESVCEEIHEIFYVYQALKNSYDALPDKSGINPINLKFVNYDDHHEPRHVGYILNCEHGLREFVDVVKNKRGGMVGKLSPHYRKMVAKWKEFEKSHKLSESQIKEILKELPL